MARRGKAHIRRRGRGLEFRQAENVFRRRLTMTKKKLSAYELDALAERAAMDTEHCFFLNMDLDAAFAALDDLGPDGPENLRRQIEARIAAIWKEMRLAHCELM
jgi:hypothetical protein